MQTTQFEPNQKLKGKIIMEYGRQYKFARIVGVSEPYVSQVINGTRGLSTEEQELWAGKLLCEVKDIFPDN